VSLPGRFVETSVGRVYVHRKGEGATPLVLLHGYMMSHWYFQGLYPRLSERRQVIAIDLPGYGESDRPAPSRFAYDYPSFAQTVLEVLDKLGVARASLLGHSMGGGVALTLAARWPERVERMVLECPAVYPLPMPVESKLVLNRTFGRFLFNGVTRGELRRQMRKQHFKDPSAVTDALVDHVWARLNRAGGRDAAWHTMQTFAALSDRTADPMRVRAPTLLVWGDEDRMVPFQHARRLARSIPGARLTVVPASGHNVHLERKDEFLRQVAPFLDEEQASSLAAAAPPAHARSSTPTAAAGATRP
jgi:pimeloyl-ACP methyl ester carboxylesterase